MANAMYRVNSVLTVIAIQLDPLGLWRESLSGIAEHMEAMDAECRSSLHQCVNGCYRALETMALIGMELQ